MMKEENDPIRHIEQFKLKIKEKGLVYQCLLDYLYISNEEINKPTKKEEESEEIFQILKEKHITTIKSEFKEFLKVVSYLWEIHQFTKKINHKIENLFLTLKEDIKSTFTEKEVFSVFRFYKNNFILLILIEHNVLSIETLINNISDMKINEWIIITYFYPEIRKYDEKYLNELMVKYIDKYGLRKFVEENDQDLDSFYTARKEGEKEPGIIELIREDKIDEFISFVEHSPIDLNQKIEIEGTIFEADPKKLTPIEYSALYGSTAIFKYLYMKEVDLLVESDNCNIIEYAIQGRNYEIIHLLEERKEIKEELNNPNNQQKYLKMSIKMYHNEIFEYFICNYNIPITEDVINLIIIFGNYQLLDQLFERNQIDLKDKGIIYNIFYSFCRYGNEEIVKFWINNPNIDINSKNKIFNHSFDLIIYKKNV